jgi:hypothetical protein
VHLEGLGVRRRAQGERANGRLAVVAAELELAGRNANLIASPASTATSPSAVSKVAVPSRT